MQYAAYLTEESARRKPSAIRALQPLVSLPGMISLGGGMPNANLFPIKNISFIKVDIEGHELEFLEGAKETIDRERPAIVLEIFNSTKKKRLTESAQRKNEQCLSLMKSYGYKQIARKNKDVLFIR